MGYQLITILGNATRDAEVRQVGQSQVAKIGVAVSEKFRKQDGTTGENVEFFDVEIWDKPGIYPYLTKGASILVCGQQRTERWQDQNGQNREAKKIRAQVVQLCGGRPQQGQQHAAQQAPQYAQPAPPQPRYAQPPMPPQAPAQPAPPQYPPMNAPEYSQPQPDDLPFA